MSHSTNLLCVKSLPGNILDCGQRCVVVRVLTHFGHILDVLDNIVLIHQENRATQETEFLAVRAVGVTETHIAMIGQCLDVVSVGGGAPAAQRKG